MLQNRFFCQFSQNKFKLSAKISRTSLLTAHLAADGHPGYLDVPQVVGDDGVEDAHRQHGHHVQRHHQRQVVDLMEEVIHHELAVRQVVGELEASESALHDDEDGGGQSDDGGDEPDDEDGQADLSVCDPRLQGLADGEVPLHGDGAQRLNGHGKRLDLKQMKDMSCLAQPVHIINYLFPCYTHLTLCVGKSIKWLM